MSERTWKLENHLCRACGGRILRCVTGTGPSPGGNPLFKCADCGITAYGMTASELCWCGMHHRNNSLNPYICLPFSILHEKPDLKNAFLSSGCDPDRGEVGVILESQLRQADT